MKELLEILDRGDFCSVVLAVAILLYVGGLVATPAQQRRGLGPAAIAAVLFALYGWLIHPPQTGQDLLSIVARALLAGGFALGLAWLVTPAVGATGRAASAAVWAVIGAPLSSIREWFARTAVRHWEQALKERRRQEDERDAPFREARRREAEERAREEAEDQFRRDEARATCDIFYALHAPDVADRFPRAEFDRYVSRFLTDREPPDVVEDRADRLLELIRQHAERILPPRKETSVPGLARWYEEKRREIEASPTDDVAKATALALLEQRCAQMLQRSIEEMNP